MQQLEKREQETRGRGADNNFILQYKILKKISDYGSLSGLQLMKELSCNKKDLKFTLSQLLQIGYITQSPDFESNHILYVITRNGKSKDFIDKKNGWFDVEIDFSFQANFNVQAVRYARKWIKTGYPNLDKLINGYIGAEIWQKSSFGERKFLIEQASKKYKEIINKRYGSYKNYRDVIAKKNGFENRNQQETHYIKSKYGSKQNYMDLFAQKKGFNSYYDWIKDIAKRRGFRSVIDFRNDKAKKLGFASRVEYENCLAQKKGFKNTYQYRKWKKLNE